MRLSVKEHVALHRRTCRIKYIKCVGSYNCQSVLKSLTVQIKVVTTSNGGAMGDACGGRGKV